MQCLQPISISDVTLVEPEPGYLKCPHVSALVYGFREWGYHNPIGNSRNFPKTTGFFFPLRRTVKSNNQQAPGGCLRLTNPGTFYGCLHLMT